SAGASLVISPFSFPTGLAGAFGAGLDHRERNSSRLFVDCRDPAVHLISHRHYRVRVAHKVAMNLADVHQATVTQPDIDERAEVDHVEHRPAKLHTDFEVVELHHVAAKDRWWEIGTEVASGAFQRLDQLVETVFAQL